MKLETIEEIENKIMKVSYESTDIKEILKNWTNEIINECSNIAVTKRNACCDLEKEIDWVKKELSKEKIFYLTFDKVKIYNDDYILFFINYVGGKNIIKSIKYNDIDNVTFNLYHFFSSENAAKNYLNSFNDILFTTYDGIDIKDENQIIYELNTFDFREFERKAGLSKNGINMKSYLKFSTKEARNNYIIG